MQAQSRDKTRSCAPHGDLRPVTSTARGDGRAGQQPVPAALTKQEPGFLFTGGRGAVVETGDAQPFSGGGLGVLLGLVEHHALKDRHDQQEDDGEQRGGLRTEQPRIVIPGPPAPSPAQVPPLVRGQRDAVLAYLNSAVLAVT